MFEAMSAAGAAMLDDKWFPELAIINFTMNTPLIMQRRMVG
jgi:hypothetical protein